MLVADAPLRASSYPSSAVEAPVPVTILHVVLSLQVGGLERVVLRLLAHTDRALYRPVVVTLDEPGELAYELVKLGVPCQSLGRRKGGFDLALVDRLVRVIDHEGARVLHTHNTAPHIYGVLAARKSRCRPPVLHTKHGRDEGRPFRRVVLEALASAFTDRVVAVSEDAARQAIEVERVSPSKVVTIPNGVDTFEYRPGDMRSARARLGVPERGFHVGTVARLAAVKDQATLVSAFAHLAARRTDVHLTLVGDGPERARLEGLATHLGVRGLTTFTGARDDVAEVLPAFDVFALSSLSEGNSLTLLEAASAGLPIVATRVGGNPEVVVEGETGMLVPPASPGALGKALVMLGESGRLAEMGRAGRARIERRFAVDRMAASYQDLYSELVGRRVS